MYTRYEVALDDGGRLTVAQQNLETSSMEVHTARGRRVRLVWEKAHVRQLEAQP
jgi:hypothetical protein